MIKHIVLFKFKASEDKLQRIQDIKKELEKLPSHIKELQSLTVGININASETWDMSLEATVNDLEALATYANHPLHQRIVKEMIAPIKADRSCVDYQL